MVIKASNSRTKKMKQVTSKILTLKGHAYLHGKDEILEFLLNDSPNWPGHYEPASIVLLLLYALPLRLTNASDYLQHAYS